jgi:hypothetical protein
MTLYDWEDDKVDYEEQSNDGTNNNDSDACWGACKVRKAGKESRAFNAF